MGLTQQVPSHRLTNVNRLTYNFQRRDAHVVRDAYGALRQVKVPEGVANILTNTDYKYTIDMYSAANVVGKTNGLYIVTNTPLKTITVENPNNNTNQLKITDSGGVVYEYQWLTNGCELVTGNGLRKEIRTTETNTLRTVTTTIQQGANPAVFQKIEKWTNAVYGERLIEEVIGTGPNAMTNSFSYTSSGYLQQVTRADGTWEYYMYDANQRPTNIFSGFGTMGVTTNGALCKRVQHYYSTNVISGSDDHGMLDDVTPRMTVEYLLGQEVARRYKVILFGEKRDISCTVTGAPWSASANLVTTNKLITTLFRHYESKQINYPNGTTEIFLYGSSFTNTTNVVLRGHLDGSGTNIDAGTKSVEVIGALGQLTSRTVIDIPSTLTISRETYQYDAASRLTNTVYLDGTSDARTYDCCTLSATGDREGTVTSFTYDGLNRLKTSTRNGITLSNIYDPAGNILQTVRYGTNGPAITVQTSTFDDAGRLTSREDALGNPTTYTNYLTANGLVRTTTHPNLSTRTETYFRDGSLKQVSGTAVHGVRYDYGATNNGTFALEVKLLANGSDSSETVLRLFDMVQRPYQESFAGGAIRRIFYNTNGQVSKTVDPDGVTTFFEYDSLGELEYTVIDMNGNGKELAGTDRVVQTVSDVFANTTYGANVRRKRTYVWPDSSSTPQLLSTIETSVEGLTNWSTLWNAGVGVVSTVRTRYTGGHRYVTNSAFDGTYTVSDFLNGRLLSETRKGSDGNQIGATTYEYDEHGRLKKSIDARNGATTFGYDNNDRQTSVTLPPVSGNTQTNLLEYNSMGWVTSVVAPDGSMHTEYYATGEPATNWGVRTYPVAYTYDYAGRRKTLTTWTNFAAAAGSAVTTWNYDANRGFLTNKAYTGGTSLKYSYTPAGRPKSRTWAREITCTYTTNAAGDIATITYTNGTPNITYTFDRLGRVKQVDQGTNVTSLAYNDIGQLMGETFNGLTISNAYNSLLLRTDLRFLISSSSQVTNSFTYDPGARLQNVSDGTYSATYSYHTNSQLVDTMRFKQSATERLVSFKLWDALNRLDQAYSSNSVVPLFGFYYTYNLANQVVAIGSTDLTTRHLTYDSLGQVTMDRKTWNADGGDVAGQQFRFQYDDIGNRRWKAAGGNEWGSNLRHENYTVNNLNQHTQRTVPGKVNMLGEATNTAIVTVNNEATYRRSNYFRAELAVNNATSAVWQGVTNIGVLNVGTNYDLVTTNIGYAFVPKTPEVFGYDADGNLTNDGRWILTWDEENRLTRMQSFTNAPAASRLTLEFAYDYRGRRVSKVVSNWTGSAWTFLAHTKFIYDDWNLVAELNGTNNAVVRSYMWGSDLSASMQGAGGVGGLLTIDAGTNGVHFAAYDGKGGNIVALVSASDGKISALYDYGPFGEPIRIEGAVAKVNPIRFSTKYRDEETDLVYYGYRYYNPTVGRWSSRDPLAEVGGPNLYAFVRNNPIGMIDPLGLQGVQAGRLWLPSADEWGTVPPKFQEILLRGFFKYLTNNMGFGFFQGAQHWLLWAGEEKRVPFDRYDPRWGPKDFQGFDKAIQDVCECCGHSFRWERNQERHLYSEGPTTILTIGGPGTYALHIEGTMSSDGAAGEPCSWRYVGDITAQADTFNFNPRLWQTHRTLPGETITIIMWYMHNFEGWGDDFPIIFEGGRHVEESGQCPN